MNTNRMKYASTPTYGMQKRGILKRTPPQKTPETPDFTQAPQPFSPLVPQNFSPVNQAANVPVQSFMDPSTVFSNSSQNQPMQQTTSVPFATPNFIQPNAAMPMQMPLQQPNFSANAMPLPLGNSAPPISGNMNAGFSPRSQGYVPPQNLQSQQPNTLPFSGMQSMPGRPSVQPAPFANANQQQPYFQGNNMQGFVQMPMQQPAMPMYPNQQQPPQLPTNNSQQSQFTVRTQPARKQREPINADMMWTLLLFAILPILFIPCLFVPSSLDFLRYLFMALCVCGLGGMWYRQMYTPSTRLIVSVVYVALSIVTIAMMLQGAPDATQTSANALAPPNTVQQTIDPNAQAAVPAPTEAQPTPEPTVSGPSEAQQRLTLFMELWRSNQTADMVSLVQPTWASAQEAPATSLFTLLANRTATEYAIEEVSGSDADNSRTITMTATIDKNNGKSPSIYRFMIIMVKEGGQWYVDPNSLATNDSITPDDENVVNSSNQSGAVTSAPRTTVTPVPPGSTMLYYNEDGGRLYHADSNCPSVSADYRPLTGTFAYSDLVSVKSEKNLTPCLQCNAPVNPAE